MSSRSSFRLAFLVASLLLSFAAQLKAQNVEALKSSAVRGTVCDTQDHPLAGVEVLLEGSEPEKSAKTSVDTQGHFRFDSLPAGTYMLRAKRDGYRQTSEGPFALQLQEAKSFVLHLERIASSSTTKDSAAAIQFSDEPQFTVAGVTDTSALGVHASSRNMPNSNALAKDTAALAHEEPTPRAASSISPEASAIRAKLATTENADLRFQLAEIEEKEGHALEAEKDYQRAAELAPTEAHLFGWGAELLLHRAFEPAIEVFAKGRQRYPQSVRMLLGLGAANYAQGSREEAAQYFLRASDLDPANPQPYLFLGRLLGPENSAPSGWTERMKRFASLHPENAMAHYLYGLALAKQGEQGSADSAESQLNSAIALDAHLGNAYLQLGLLHSERKDFPGAVSLLQKAVEFTPFPDEAHYHLADIYRRTGDSEKARQETALYKQNAARKADNAEHERHEIQQFIYTLGTSTTTPQPPAATPDPH